MSGTRWCAGDPAVWNHVARTASIVAPVMSPAAAAAFPVSKVHDLDSQTPTQFGSTSATSTITKDINILPGGTFEVWAGGNPQYLTRVEAGTGTVVQSATVHAGGSTLAALCSAGATGASMTAALYVDITVRAGEYIKLDFWSRGDGTNAPLYRLENPDTGRCWTGSAWSTTPTSISTGQTAAAYANYTPSPIQVESYQAAFKDTMTLRVILTVAAVNSATALWDDCVIYPGVDVSAVVGHNITWHDTIQLRYSTDNFGASDVLATTFALRQPSMYAGTSSYTLIYARYWRLRLFRTGTLPSVGAAVQVAPFVAEWILAQSTLQAFNGRNPNLSAWTTERVMPQQRNLGRGGGTWVYNLGSHGLRRATLPLQESTEAELNQIIFDLVERSGYGLHPMLLIPWDAEGSVIYGRIPAAHADARVHNAGAVNMWQDAIEVQESGFFVVGA